MLSCKDRGQNQQQRQDLLHRRAGGRAKERDRLGLFHGSKNNWESVFMTGLLEHPTLEWLFSQIARAGRTSNEVLEWQ